MMNEALLDIKHDEVIEKLEKCQKKGKVLFVFIHVRFYIWWKIIAHIIALAGLIKGSKSKISHTTICYYDNGWIVAEAVKKGIVQTLLRNKFFTGKFKGKLKFHVILGDFDVAGLRGYINARDEQSKYKFSDAYKAWYEPRRWLNCIFKKLRINYRFKIKKKYDNPTRVFCEDFALDCSEFYVNSFYKRLKARFKFHSNKEIEPWEGDEMLDSFPEIEAFDIDIR